MRAIGLPRASAHPLGLLSDRDEAIPPIPWLDAAKALVGLFSDNKGSFMGETWLLLRTRSGSSESGLRSPPRGFGCTGLALGRFRSCPAPQVH